MANTQDTAKEKVSKEIIRLKHLIATRVVIKIEDAIAFLEDVLADFNQPDPVEPDNKE